MEENKNIQKPIDTMEENATATTIDIRVISKKLWSRRWLFAKVLAITFVVSCIYILGVPRYYTTDARLAPEMGGATTGGLLGSFASSIGIDFGDMQTTDAIYPTLYPDLLEDDGFVASLFSIQVASEDGEINTSYHDYLKKHQKQSVWSYPMSQIKKLFKKKPKKSAGAQGEFNPYMLSESEFNVAEAIRGNIQFSINEKTGVITIRTKAQDPLICKTLADSVKEHLQNFITEYRTNKARIDYEYYQQLAAKAKAECDSVRLQYAKMADANSHVALRSVELKMEALESEMQMKLNAYATIANQLEAAKAKVQERTPAFTLLKGASVPLRPAGPKRMFFVAFMLILATLAISVFILRHDLTKIIAVKAG